MKKPFPVSSIVKIIIKVFTMNIEMCTGKETEWRERQADVRAEGIKKVLSDAIIKLQRKKKSFDELKKAFPLISIVKIIQ